VSRSPASLSNKAAEAVSKPLLDRAVRPHDNRDKTAVFAGFVEHILTQLNAPLVVCDAFGIPSSEELHARIATPDCVDDGNRFHRVLAHWVMPGPENGEPWKVMYAFLGLPLPAKQQSAE
jgi:hypothetical protein